MVQRRLGRVPQATWRASSALTTGRSAAWVTPTSLASVVITRTGSPVPSATMVATTSGSSTSALGTSPPAATAASRASSSRPEASMAESKTSQMAGWKPHRLTEAGRSPASSAGSSPSSEVKRCAVVVPGDLPPLGQGHQVAAAVDLADPPGHRVVGGHGGAELVADQGMLVGVGRQLAGQQAHGHLAVDVVGVGTRRTSWSRPRATWAASTACTVPSGQPLLGEGHVDRRPASTARRGSGWPVPSRDGGPGRSGRTRRPRRR